MGGASFVLEAAGEGERDSENSESERSSSSLWLDSLLTAALAFVCKPHLSAK